MERREKKKRGREGEAMKSSEKGKAKKRGLLLSGDSCLCDNNNLEEEGEQSNEEHRPPRPRKYEEEDGNGLEVGVFDFPWLKEGATSKGYYDDDHYECRLEFEDLVAGCWSGGAYDASSSASTCLDFSDFSLDHHFFQQNYDYRTTMTKRSEKDNDNDNDRGGELPILRDKNNNVEELDGIWSSVLDQPLDNNIVSFHKL